MSLTAHHRRKQPEQVRRALLDATMALAEEQGLAGVSVQAVAARAGVTKGGLFHHFASKSALVEAVFDDIMSRVDAALDRHLAADDAPGAFTRAYVNVTFTDAGEVFGGKALSLSMVVDPALRERWRAWIQARLARHAATDADPGLHVVRLAADGHWFTQMLQGAGLGPEPDAVLHQRLLAMTRP